MNKVPFQFVINFLFHEAPQLIFTVVGLRAGYLFKATLELSHLHLPGCLVQGILLLEALALPLLVPQLRAEVIQQTLQSVQQLSVLACLTQQSR